MQCAVYTVLLQCCFIAYGWIYWRVITCIVYASPLLVMVCCEVCCVCCSSIEQLLATHSFCPFLWLAIIKHQ